MAHPLRVLRFLALLAVLAPAGRAVPSDVTVHLTKEQALEHAFPDARQVLEMRHLLSADELARIEQLTGERLDEGGFYVYAGLRDGAPTGYAVVVAQIGKVRPITHIVGVTPEGSVSTVAVMVYRESHGGEVADPRFLEQYEGKTLEDPIRIDHDVINIAGATLSGHAICRGVRKALAVVQAVVLERSPEQRAALLQSGADVTPAALSGRAAAGDATAPTHLRRERQVMGSACRVEAWSARPPEELAPILEATLDEVAHWDDVLSDWRDDTDLARLNAAPVGEAVPVSADLLAWLEDAEAWQVATEGAFDPAVGALVDAWGLEGPEPARPGPSVLAAAREASGWGALALDRKAGTVTRLRPGLRLDPGASGKGFALDRAAARLREAGVSAALIAFRSTLLALDPPPGEAGWSVPVVHDGDGRIVSVLELAHEALSVSSGGLRAFDDEGVARGHVLDPRLGTPVPAGRLAWVRHPSAAAADALSTALLVRGTGLAPVEQARGAFLSGPDAAPEPWPRLP